MPTKKTKMPDKPKELPLEARVIQCLNNFIVPKTTQDAVDQLAVSFLVANLFRTHADKRYEGVKRMVLDEYGDKINNMRELATSTMSKTTASIVGEDYVINFAANKPATKVDANDLRTELVKRGVDITLIDEAIAKVEKKSTPALIIGVSRSE